MSSEIVIAVLGVAMSIVVKLGWFLVGVITAAAWVKFGSLPARLRDYQVALEEAQAGIARREEEIGLLRKSVSNTERELELMAHERDNALHEAERLGRELDEANHAYRSHRCPEPDIHIQMPPYQERF